MKLSDIGTDVISPPAIILLKEYEKITIKIKLEIKILKFTDTSPKKLGIIFQRNKMTTPCILDRNPTSTEVEKHNPAATQE